jgi:hypothetical protein
MLSYSDGSMYYLDFQPLPYCMRIVHIPHATQIMFCIRWLMGSEVFDWQKDPVRQWSMNMGGIDYVVTVHADLKSNRMFISL